MSLENEEARMTAEELFWDLVEPMYADPAVQRSTMMGLPCVRLDQIPEQFLGGHTRLLILQ